jgi:hypothetical protein
MLIHEAEYRFPRTLLLRLSEKSEQASNLGSVSPQNRVKALLPKSYRPTSLSCDSTPTTFQTVSLGSSVDRDKPFPRTGTSPS